MLEAKWCLVEQRLFRFLLNTIYLRKRKMQTQKNKIAAITIVIFFILSTISSLALMPASNAHTPPYTIPTFAYISVQPNPVGIGQQASLNFWIDQVPPTANQAWGDRWGNFTVKVTQPDGTIRKLGAISHLTPQEEHMHGMYPAK